MITQPELWRSRVPAHWEWVPLRYVATVGTGHTPDRSRADYWIDCDIPWVTAADLSGRSSEFAPLTDTAQYVSPLGVANSAAVVHPANTVMFCRTASVGLLAITGKPMATTQAFVTWTPGPRLHPRYLLYVLSALRPELFRLAYGSTHLTIYMPDLEALRIPLPPMVEQESIVAYLDFETSQAELVVQTRREQLRLLAERRVAAAREATTRGLSSRPTRATGVPYMPQMVEDWDLRRLGRSFRTGSGTTPKATEARFFDGPHAWVNTGDLRDGPISAAKRSVTDEALAEYSTLRFYDPGALVVAMYGATIGRVGRLDIRACVNQACCVLYDSTHITPDFAFYWFLGHRARIIELAAGGGQPNISQEVVRSLRIPTPSLSEQGEIVKELARQDLWSCDVRDLMASQVDVLVERMRATVEASVTGQRDIATSRSVA